MFLVSRESKWNGWNLFDDIGLTFLEMYIETMMAICPCSLCVKIYMFGNVKRGREIIPRERFYPLIKHVEIDLRFAI